MSLKQLIPNEEKHRRIRQLIEQYKLSGSFEHYGELAILIDYSKNTLYPIMAGKKDPPDILIYKFCEYYQLQPAWFFGRAESVIKISNVKIDYSDIKFNDLIELQQTCTKIAHLTAKLINKVQG